MLVLGTSTLKEEIFVGSRFLLKSAKLNTRENFQNWASAKLNSAKFSKIGHPRN